ncbi:MAG TPA: TonB-dependent receptor [Acidobacteriaceae bacterium]|jgi:iron complex outermembrane receptor protein
MRILSAMVLPLVFGTVDPALAQLPKPDLADATLEELGNIPVYSASKHLQPSGEAPSSVTVVTGNQIREQGYRTLADVLRTVRSFFVTYDRNYSSLGVRGFARPGDYNTRILLLVDGHRLNDNIYDEAMIGTEFPIDVDLIQRIEIVRGPVSSLYGSNALFAVINIITKHGRDLNRLELSAEAASYNTWKGSVSYGRTLPQGEFLISGSFYGSKGHNQLFYPEFNTPQTDNGIARHADDDQLATALATASSHGFTLQAAYATREKGIPTAAYGTIFNNSGTRTTDDHEYFDLSYARMLFGSWDMLARTFYDRYTYQGTYVYPSPIDPAQTSPNLDFADGKWWGTELQVTKNVSRNRITAGGEYRDNLRQNQSNYSLNPYVLGLDDRRQSFIGALYLQDEFAFSSNLSVNAGLRYDYYSSVKASTDPRIAVVYHPTPGNIFKLVYGQSFRAPNVYEKYYSVAPNLPNPSLSPERIQSSELVWERHVSDWLWISTSAFHNNLKNLITQEPVAGYDTIFRNLGRVESNGLEVEFNGQVRGGLEGIASYSFQETKDSEAETFLDDSPRHLGKVSLTQAVLRKTLFVSLNAQYRSRMTTIASGAVSPFAVFNVDLLGRKIAKHVDVTASIYNLLDKTYYDPPSTAISQAAIQQDGRSFRVKMTWHLGER